MAEINVELLRKYLRRCIAENNKKIGGICKNFVAEGRAFRNDIYREFARGSDYLYRIDRDIAYRGKKDVAIYNYFDLDTLIAYNKYLEAIIQCTEQNRFRAGRKYSTPRDISVAIHEQVPKYFIFHKREECTGFYDPEDTITPLVDDRGHLAYERTPDKRAFESKHNEYQLYQMLADYIDSRFYTPVSIPMQFDFTPRSHSTSNTPSNSTKSISTQNAKVNSKQDGKMDNTQCAVNIATAKQNPAKQGEPQEFSADYDDEPVCTMEINNEKYMIYRLDNYFDIHFAPIKYIEGESENGRIAIRGYVDMDAKGFYGDVYDNEGGLVADSTQTGLDMYVDGIPYDQKFRY